MTFKGKKFHCKNNGQKGGRPKQDSNSYITLPDISLVMLTDEQYDTLLNKYGACILTTALKIFDNWLLHGGIANKHIGKNNYAHFRSDGWVINEAKRVTALN